VIISCQVGTTGGGGKQEGKAPINRGKERVRVRRVSQKRHCITADRNLIFHERGKSDVMMRTLFLVMRAFSTLVVGKCRSVVHAGRAKEATKSVKSTSG